ncbi:MarR family transcriptional regulator [Cellulophaga baltica]|uniref:MarR family winged helix-turn-helix transcriptional regulator n=1 Tax=Cellulophaga TaxID=104264 RepID=UPI001C07E0E5|nr:MULTISPECIES: MarR family transcriptional regulator [Cellulophaga]MBU2994948.1 MarR family transcriptional regulator [Cellulophaga baltica]MDO6766343.1 MarR family transcriptional regulator [Cellulophaga sp. 1_MG-2023]
MNVEQVIKTDIPIPLKQRTLIHLSLVTNKINETVASQLKPYDVSLQQFNVLRILRGQKGKPANLSTLNERMVTKMSNTTRLVDKLIIKKFVKRSTCETNRRKVDIYITEDGEKALLQMDNAMKKAQDTILKNFNTEDLKNLNNLFDKF